MSKQINISDSTTVIPSGYILGQNISESIDYPIANGYANSSSTTYSRFSLSNNTTGYIYYTFDLSQIPSTATITSITGNVKARVNNTSRVTNTVCQLYSGTTAKGSNVTFSSTDSSNVVSLSPGSSWTVSELENLRLRIGGSGSGGNQTKYIYFYGADITINYSLNGINYEIVSSNLSDDISSIDPEGLTEVFENTNYTLNIYGSSIDNIEVLDNGVDVTSQLVQNEINTNQSTVLGEYTLISGSFNTYNSGANYFPGLVGNGVDADKTTSNYYSGGSSTIAVFTYKLLFNDIPSNAIITRLYCQVNGHAESTSNNSEYMCVQLRSGNIELSEEINFKSIGTSNSTQTLEAITLPTVSQLEDLVLYCHLGYYGGALNGATCYIEYTLPGSNYYWTYNLNNVQSDHTIIIQNSIIEIPEEDPQYNYYPITISSINATTDPSKGTTRVVEGTNQTITIYPSESQITLVTDNGVDITSQLVTHGGDIPTPTVSNVSGADYGFTLNSYTGYYVSQNDNQDETAALCRVTFNLPVRCLVTIEFINYGEETYDFGVFGKIDTELSTNSWNSSGYTGDTTTDAGKEQLRCNTSEYNKSTTQTLNYEIPSGEHFIDIKYGKDQASSENNDTLQWKILSIEPLEPNNYYTYTLSNIQEEHSLIFIFGDVTYYFVNSSGTNCKLFPSGSLVQLPGDNYSLTIVPNNYNYTVTLKDNNVSVTPTRKEEEITKDGNTYTVVNYVYTLTNIQTTHNLIVTCTPSIVYYIKLNGTWEAAIDVLLKQDDRWGTLTNIENIFRDNLIFYKDI